MLRSTVIWSCPACDHWEWGGIDLPPQQCWCCGADMSRAEADREAALETLYCMKFHERHEEKVMVHT